MYKFLRCTIFSSFLILEVTTFISSGLAQNTTNEKNSEDSKKEENKDTKFEPIFGHMDMFFGMMKTKYDDTRHSIFYPHPRWGGFIGVNYNWLRKYLSLGLQTKFGFYKDRGNPSVSKDFYDKDVSTKLTRPLFPLQASFTLGFSPFAKKMWIIPKKLLTIRGWCGLEYLYGQEQRASGDEDAYVDKIRLSSLVYGISPWLLISFFDQKTANSLYVINVKSIYLSWFMEWTHTLSHSRVVDFDRSIMGFSLIFETI